MSDVPDEIGRNRKEVGPSPASSTRIMGARTLERREPEGRSFYDPSQGIEESSLVVLESGRIRFFVRPRVGVEIAVNLAEVQRFVFTLAPLNGARVRRVSVGDRRMPDDGVRERHWAHVDRVGSAADVFADLRALTYVTKARGVRHQRAATELVQGRYALAAHRGHAHLLYELDEHAAAYAGAQGLLRQLRVVQRGSYIAAVLSGARGGLEHDSRSSEPSMFGDMLDRFGQRRFVPLEPAFLDREGAAIVLIGGSAAHARFLPCAT